MKSALEFIHRFLAAETEASVAMTKPDMDAYNIKYEALMDLTNRQGISLNKARMILRHSDDFYEDAHLLPPAKDRYLYKLEKYDHPTYGTIYRAVLSFPDSMRKTYGHALIIAEQNGAMRVVAEFVWGSPKWIFVGGDESFKGWLGRKKPLEVERFFGPEDDALAMKDYVK